jgi:hypothetical protein
LVVPDLAAAADPPSWTNPCTADLDPGVCERTQYLAETSTDQNHRDLWFLAGVGAVIILAPGLWRVLLV